MRGERGCNFFRLGLSLILKPWKSQFWKISGGKRHTLTKFSYSKTTPPSKNKKTVLLKLAKKMQFENQLHSATTADNHQAGCTKVGGEKIFIEKAREKCWRILFMTNILLAKSLLTGSLLIRIGKVVRF